MKEFQLNTIEEAIEEIKKEIEKIKKAKLDILHKKSEEFWEEENLDKQYANLIESERIRCDIDLLDTILKLFKED